MLNPQNPSHIKSLEKCRKIKQEIVNFGINENEIIKLIELLALELENASLMKSIIDLVKKEVVEEKEEVNLFT